MAGLVAACHGAEVVVLEKTTEAGGGTALSHKGLRGAGTRYQQALGIEDDPAGYAEEIIRRNRGESDEGVVRRLAEVSGRMIDFLGDEAGIEFYLDDFSFGQSARRSHTWTSSHTIADYLFAALSRRRGAEIRFLTTAMSLVSNSDGGVTGVIANDQPLVAGKVILASGGFGASREMLAGHIPKAVGIPFPGHSGSTGDGIAMGVTVGGVLENMGSFQPYPAHIGPGKRGLPPGVIMSGGIMVDATGRRFVDESTYPGGVAAAMLDLPGCRAFEVFDETVFREHQEGPAERALGAMVDGGDLKRAGSLAHLADALGVESVGLATSVAAYNAHAGSTDEFGRRVARELVAPFYGAEVTVALYHTQGGLRINRDAQVLRADGSVIENIYAGGGVTAGLSGGGVDGYLPGNGLLASLGLGLLAAEHAVASLSRPDLQVRHNEPPSPGDEKSLD